MTPGSTHSHSDPSIIARALSERAEDVVRALLGEPTATSRHEQRWGRRGSLSLKRCGAKRGLWYDHERGEGGDILDLVARELNVRLGEAMRIAERDFLGEAHTPGALQQPRRSQSPAGDDGEARTRGALRLWSGAVPTTGTLAERYFVEHRRLDIRQLDLRHAVRWHGGKQAIIALMTNAVSGEPIGIHRTFLDADGAKIDRQMLGRQGVVRLSPDDAVIMGLGVTEGIEDGMAVLLSGWAPVWAATSAGAIVRFPVLSGVEALTLFADADAPGMRAAETCAANWRVAGRDVRLAFGKAVARA
jgi:putative DNA primase/helicase